MAKPVRFTPEMFERYRSLGYWTQERLSEHWDRCADLWPDREAIADSRTRLTWKQSQQWIDRMALGLLELGLKKDDMLVVQLPNSVELTLLRVATEKASVLCLPVLRTFRHKEMEYILQRTQAAALVVPWHYRGFDYLQMVQELKPNLPNLKHVITVWDDTPPGTVQLKSILEKPLEERYPPDFLRKNACPADEYSLVLTTSGTTGFPKFVEHPVCSRVYIGRVYARGWEMDCNEVIAVVGPAATGPNHAAYWSAPLIGARQVILEHFEAEATLQLIEKEKVTFTGFVPAQLAMVIRHPNFGKYDIRSLRVVVCTGAPLSYQLGTEAEAKLGCPIVQSYGAVDSGGSMMHSPRDSQEVRYLTAGRPMTGVEMKLVDDNGNEVPAGAVGEVWVRGPTFVSGYFKDTDATSHGWTSDGWFQMGDLGKWDGKGNIAIVGRKKDMIIRGGQNIYPVEIENLMILHPKVGSIAVVAMPDPIMGERACAFVVPKPGQTLAFEEMVAFLIEKNIAKFKIPERLEIIDRFPMVAADQKIDKKLLQQIVREKMAAEGKL
ncbi:MAG: AMP-binding protein [Chloroflexi bacterium]|nr:AMP-binding protein [Chloroflexota bacterium]